MSSRCATAGSDALQRRDVRLRTRRWPSSSISTDSTASTSSSPAASARGLRRVDADDERPVVQLLPDGAVVAARGELAARPSGGCGRRAGRPPRGCATRRGSSGPPRPGRGSRRAGAGAAPGRCPTAARRAGAAAGRARASRRGASAAACPREYPRSRRSCASDEVDGLDRRAHRGLAVVPRPAGGRRARRTAGR